MRYRNKPTQYEEGGYLKGYSLGGAIGSQSGPSSTFGLKQFEEEVNLPDPPETEDIEPIEGEDSESSLARKNLMTDDAKRTAESPLQAGIEGITDAIPLLSQWKKIGKWGKKMISSSYKWDESLSDEENLAKQQKRDRLGQWAFSPHEVIINKWKEKRGMAEGGAFKVIKEDNGDPVKEGLPTTPSDSINTANLKTAIAKVESAGGQDWAMKSPTSSATGLYGQLYNEAKHLPILEGISRDEFAGNKELQNQVFDIRLNEGIGGPSLKRNAIELTEEYKPQFDAIGKSWGFNLNDMALLSNYLGRQGLRNWLRGEITGKPYNPPGMNKPVWEYLEEARQAIDN